MKKWKHRKVGCLARACQDEVVLESMLASTKRTATHNLIQSSGQHCGEGRTGIVLVRQNKESEMQRARLALLPAASRPRGAEVGATEAPSKSLGPLPSPPCLSADDDTGWREPLCADLCSPCKSFMTQTHTHTHTLLNLLLIQ